MYVIILYISRAVNSYSAEQNFYADFSRRILKMVEKVVAKDSSAGNSSAQEIMRSLLSETPSTSTHDSSGPSDDADFEVSRVTRSDGSTVYLCKDHVIEAQQLAQMRDKASFKITVCEKWLDFAKMDIMKLQHMIELDQERLSKKMQQRDDWQFLLDEARKLMGKLQNLQQFSNESSETQDTRKETEQSGIEVEADLSLTKTAVPSVCLTEAISLPPQQLLLVNVEDGWSDAPSLPDESHEIGLNGIQPNQVSASTTFDFNLSEPHVHSDDGSNDADESSLVSLNLDHRKRKTRKRKSESSSVRTEEHEDTTATSSTTPAKKSRVSPAEKAANYQQLLAQLLVRDNRQTLEEYKKRKVETEELRELGLHTLPVAVSNLWVPISAYLAKKHNINRDRKEVRNDACALCAMNVDELTRKFGLTMDEAMLLRGLFS